MPFAMNQGKTVFAQLMNMIPEYEFDKCVARLMGTILLLPFPQPLGLDSKLKLIPL